MLEMTFNGDNDANLPVLQKVRQLAEFFSVGETKETEKVSRHAKHSSLYLRL
jgi:hypothetical protein